MIFVYMMGIKYVESMDDDVQTVSTLDMARPKTLVHWSDSSGDEDNGARVINGKIVKEHLSIDSFTFAMLPDNPFYDGVTEITTLVMALDEGGEVVFYGRVDDVSLSYEAGKICKNVTCVGCGAFLNDLIVEWASTTLGSNTVDASKNAQKRSNWLIGYNGSLDRFHKSGDSQPMSNMFGDSGFCMDTMKGFGIKTLPTRYGMTVGGKHSTTWDVLRGIAESSGSAVIVRPWTNDLYKCLSMPCTSGGSYSASGKYSKGPLVVEMPMLSSAGTLHDDAIEPSVNMISVSYGDGFSGFATCCALTSSKYSAFSDCNTDGYGVIFSIGSYNGEDDQLSIQKAASASVKDTSKINYSVRMSAVDLSHIDTDFSRFRLYDRVPVRNEFLGIDETLQIVKITIGIDDPWLSSIELGSKVATSSASQAATAYKAGGAWISVDRLEGDIYGLLWSGELGIINNLKYATADLSGDVGDYDRIKYVWESEFPLYSMDDGENPITSIEDSPSSVTQLRKKDDNGALTAVVTLATDGSSVKLKGTAEARDTYKFALKEVYGVTAVD